MTAAACVFKRARNKQAATLLSPAEASVNERPAVGLLHYSHDPQTWLYSWSNHCLHRCENSSSSAIMIQLVRPRLCLFLFLLSAIFSDHCFILLRSWVSSFSLASFRVGLRHWWRTSWSDVKSHLFFFLSLYQHRMGVPTLGWWIQKVVAESFCKSDPSVLDSRL